MRKIEWLLISLTTVFVAVVLPTFNKGHAMEFGTTADWIIAFSNFAMAIAAVYAALRAREWFQDKSSLNQLDTSHQFALQHEALLWKTNEKVFNDVIVRQELFFEIKRPNVDIDSIRISLNDMFTNSTREEVEYFGTLKNHEVMLKRYKITPSSRLLLLTSNILIARKKYQDAYYQVIFSILKKLTMHQTDIEEIDLSVLETEMKNVCRIFEKELVKVQIGNDYSFS